MSATPPLSRRLAPCAACKTRDGVEVSHELLGACYVAWCGICGASTDTAPSLDGAVEAWNALQARPPRRKAQVLPMLLRPQAE
jgi:hypothetical protein